MLVGILLSKIARIVDSIAGVRLGAIDLTVASLADLGIMYNQS